MQQTDDEEYLEFKIGAGWKRKEGIENDRENR